MVITKKGWTATTEPQKKFKMLMESLQQKSEAIPFLAFHELVKMSKTTDDVRHACLIFKLMILKFYSFTVESSNLMLKMLCDAEMEDVAVEIVKNSVLFKLPMHKDAFFSVFVKHLVDKGDVTNACAVFSLVLEKKVLGFQEPDVHDFYRFFSLLDMENDEHATKVMEFYEKFPKPLCPLVGQYSGQFVERLLKSYEIIAKAAEKTSKDVEKVQSEFEKYKSSAVQKISSKSSVQPGL